MYCHESFWKSLEFQRIFFHANRSFEKYVDVCGNFQNDLYLTFDIIVVT